MSETPENENVGGQVPDKDVDGLVRDNDAYRRENAALINAIQYMTSQVQNPPVPAPDAGKDSGPPRREQYMDDFAFFSAQQTYELERMRGKMREEVDRVIQERIERESKARKDSAIRDSVSMGRASHHDFDQVVRDAPINDSMIEILSQFDDPHEIAYWMGKNKQDAARIANLPPARLAYELGKIADKLKESRPEAVEPMTPVSGGTANASIYDTTSPASDKLSDAEYYARDAEYRRNKGFGW